ncbi:MarR family winged helix-turn-helix transcriptional regulator [Timonella sp. A28]|uniref:MarR family winged helix-turn-helix transcriptional regulator n=1 Tax=Timonella sp. A28 TaxID=3442640 RepID=UPI003EB87EC9
MTPESTSSHEWLNEHENEAWVALVDLMLRLPSTLDSKLQKECHLSFYEYMVLAMLSEQPDRTLGMGTLAGLTSGSLSRLSHVITRLEKAGYVTRTRGSHDKRHTNAHLTEAGWEKIVDSAPTHVAQVRETVFNALSNEHVQQLTTIANAIRINLDADCLGPKTGKESRDKTD